MNIKITILSCEEVSGDCTVKTIAFTGSADGNCFCGKTVGTGIDTQKLCGENGTVSARYLLEGTDGEKKPCRVFIENNGEIKGGVIGRTKPEIVTDSPFLRNLVRGRLYGELVQDETGLYIKIKAEE